MLHQFWIFCINLKILLLDHLQGSGKPETMQPLSQSLEAGSLPLQVPSSRQAWHEVQQKTHNCSALLGLPGALGKVEWMAGRTMAQMGWSGELLQCMGVRRPMWLPSGSWPLSSWLLWDSSISEISISSLLHEEKDHLGRWGKGRGYSCALLLEFMHIE